MSRYTAVRLRTFLHTCMIATLGSMCLTTLLHINGYSKDNSSSAQSPIGFFSEDYVARKSPPFQSTMVKDLQVSQKADVTFRLHLSDTINQILPSIFGNNANFYLYHLEDDSAGLAHLRATGLKNLRLPGGNASNAWLWDGQVQWDFWENYQNTLKSAPRAAFNLSVDQQAALADSLGAMPQPCVNLSLARYIKGPDSVAQAASYAADWVRQWNIVEGRQVKYWEVGNENYGGWQAGYKVNGDTITGTMYGEMFNVFADSMKAVDPSIKIGAVVYEGDTAQWTGSWNQDLLPIVQDKADFLAVHQYFTWAPNINDVSSQDVISALSEIQHTKELLQRHVEENTHYDKDHFPIAMTEYNVRAGRKNSQQISAVFNAMALGEYVTHQYGLVNLWDVANAFNNGDDHGMLTRNDPDRNNYDPNPTFYSYYLTHTYFGDHLIRTQPAADQGIRVYSTLFSEGNLGLLVVNSSDQAQIVELDLGDFQAQGGILSHHLNASGPEDREVTLNDISQSNYSGPLNYADIKPYQWSFTHQPKFNTKAYSVNTLFIEKAGSTTSFTQPKHLGHQSSRQRFQLVQPGSSLIDLEITPQEIQFFSINGRKLQLEWDLQRGTNQSSQLEIKSDLTQPILLKLSDN